MSKTAIKGTYCPEREAEGIQVCLLSLKRAGMFTPSATADNFEYIICGGIWGGNEHWEVKGGQKGEGITSSWSDKTTAGTISSAAVARATGNEEERERERERENER